MPLFDYLCLDCGKANEVLVLSPTDQPQCNFCDSRNLKKLLSPHSSYAGSTKNSLPGLNDTTCCGSSPDQANCAGPGSCCGKL